MPVVLHLSAWAHGDETTASGERFEDWLLDQLGRLYGITARVSRYLVEHDELSLLLDGLDEVLPERRAACVKAVNGFRKRHGTVPMVICCRVRDYEMLEKLGKRLALGSVSEVGVL